MKTLCKCGHAKSQHHEGKCDYSGYSCSCCGYDVKPKPNEAILFVDDVKTPESFGLPKNTTWANTAKRAIKMWKSGKYEILYLDFDLGSKKNGLDVLRECIDFRKPKYVFFITWNPVGRQRLRAECISANIPHRDIIIAFSLV